MEAEQRPSGGHILQPPHFEVRAADFAEFRPLYLVLEPDGSRIAVIQPNSIVGRHSDTDIRLPWPDVSRRHCRLAWENGQWRIIDLNSTNGVFVNGERMHEANLYDGDKLGIAHVTFRVEDAAAASRVEPPKQRQAS